jgi:hypothetical protein
MANTPLENSLAQSAFRAICANYGKHLNMSPSVQGFSQAMMLGKGIELYVKFMDNKPFLSNFGMCAKGNRLSNCTVCGFTSPTLGNKYEREMYINRDYANSSTVVHEMLHFLTHPMFWDFVGSGVTESITEYFTRKVISKTKDEAFDINQRKGRYDSHHSFLTLQRGFVKAGKPKDGYMKAAYFGGDPESISFILKSFADLEELVAL